MSNTNAKALRRWAVEATMLRRSKFKKRTPFKKWHIYKGDKVEILSGSNKGEQGVVAEVFREQSMVTVANTKVNRKAQKGTETQAGGLVNVPAKIHISKVNLVDPASGKATRISWRYKDDGTKTRVSVKTGSTIPRPADLTGSRMRRLKVIDTDTKEEDVLERTYVPPVYTTSSSLEEASA